MKPKHVVSLFQRFWRRYFGVGYTYVVEVRGSTAGRVWGRWYRAGGTGGSDGVWRANAQGLIYFPDGFTATLPPDAIARAGTRPWPTFTFEVKL